jgi:AcrR family transcriptional regulator
MSPRPRKVTDDQLFAAVQAVMSRVGPRELTLDAIAKEAGVTAAVLVQRFGSKRALLLALFKKVSSEGGTFIDDLAGKHASPLAALRAYADCMAGMATSPAALARNLAYLQIDLTDPEFRKHLAKQARATRAGFRRLLKTAVEERELKPVADPKRLARTVEALLSGSMLTWAFYRKGSASEWMRSDLDSVLAPYVTKRRG